MLFKLTLSSVGAIALCGATLTAQGSVLYQGQAPAGPHLAVFDSNRGILVAVDRDGLTHEWDGTSWNRFGGGAPGVQGTTGAMAFEQSTGRMIVFVSDTGATWARAGSTWSQVSSAGPGSRFATAMAYDAGRDRIVLHGGHQNYTTYFNDTWEWDGTTWTQVSTSGPAISQHNMVYDPSRGDVVLHGGGVGILGTVERDNTWTWDGTNWNRVSTVGPSRNRGVMTYDAGRDRIVLIVPSPGIFTPGQIWEWDRSAWSSVTQTTGFFPLGGPSLTHDPVRNASVYVQNGETYEWDGSTITATASQPVFVRDCVAEFDETQQQIVVADVSLDRTLVFDGSSWTVATGPALDREARIAFDHRRGVLVAVAPRFGGMDTYEWNGSAWIATPTPATTPASRTDFDIAFDPATGTILLFGGRESFQPVGDTWSWNGADWQRVATTGPSPRSRHRMATDTRRNRVVLFGGETPATDTWEWDGTTWTLIATTGPARRDRHEMAYDPIRGRTILTGGFGSATAASELWEWDGREWQVAQLNGVPDTYRHGMFFDGFEQRVGLLGGRLQTTNQGLMWLARSQFGAGCGTPGSSPVLTPTNDRVALGGTLQLDATDLPLATATAVLLLDVEPVVPSLPLDSLGLPGCAIHVSSRWQIPLTVSQGTATASAAVPTSPALAGLRIYSQLITGDPQANALGLVLSNGAVVVLQ